MKIIYLLPPSEGKNSGGELGGEKLNFPFEKPLKIAINATQKDLKCKDKRFEEGIDLNKNIQKSETLPAIERYSGVMYNAIDYKGMNQEGKRYFEDNFYTLSGMYGVLKPKDTIGNYKLPIETKGLYAFWGKQVTQTLQKQEADYIVDMLPGSYAKMIDWKNIKTPFVRINFLTHKDGQLKKITHGVKKVKGEYIHKLCNNIIKDISQLDGKMRQISEFEYAIDIIS